MGASTFDNYVQTDKSLREAFRECVEQAEYDHGHSGGSGTIAEKTSVTLIASVETLKEAYDMMNELIDSDSELISNKWGPAGAIKVTGANAGFLFFGWAPD